MLRTSSLLFCCVACLGVNAWGQQPAKTPVQKSIYLIGNSLTWDTIPSRLDEDIQWHVDCGKSLKYIYDNPQMPCVKTSTLWPDALKSKKYDVVSVQPHYGTTLEEEIATISKWIELQPQAVFIIHTGWARSATLAEEYERNDPQQPATVMSHNPVYFSELISALQKKYPETRFRTTHCMRLLSEIKKGIDEKKIPLEKIEDLYRDAIHMTTTAGRYLMHNAMRETIGQRRTSEGFEKIPKELIAVLDDYLDQRNTWELAIPGMKVTAQ